MSEPQTTTWEHDAEADRLEAELRRLIDGGATHQQILDAYQKLQELGEHPRYER